MSLFTKGIGCEDKIFVGVGVIVLVLGKMLVFWIVVVNGLLLYPTVSLKSFLCVCCKAILEPILLEPKLTVLVLLPYIAV